MLRETVSGIMLTLLLMGMSTLAFNVQPVKAGTIIVPDDYLTIQEAINAAEPGDAIQVSAETYYENIVVNKTVSLMGESKIETIIDGGGVGTVVNVTANDVVINGFTVKNSGQEAGEHPDSEMDSGICVHMANNVSVVDNLVTDNADGIRLYESSNSNVSGNVAENNARYGILLYNCSKNNLRNNTMTDNKYNFGEGGYIQHYARVNVSNTVNGKPIYYWINQHDRVIPADAGYVLILNCTGITIEDLNLTNNRHGVELVFSRNSIVRNVNATNNALDGILLYEGSSNITVTGCTSLNNRYGVRLVGAKDNTIFDNVAMNNTVNGIYLRNSNNNTVVSNLILDSGSHGISLGGPEGSHNNIISGNVVDGNDWHGIRLGGPEGSHNNTVIDNWATNNTQCGFGLFDSSDNFISSNVAENNIWGIALVDSYKNIIASNWATNNTKVGIGLWGSLNNRIRSDAVENNGREGIYLYNSSSNTVVSNWALNNGLHGICLEESQNNIVESNVAANSTWQGILLTMTSNDNLVVGNQAMNNSENGIYLYNSSSNDVVANWIEKNSWNGIVLDVSSDNTIGSNTVLNNTNVGIGLWDSTDNTIRSNLAETNGNDGFYLQNSTGSIITGNTAIRNKGCGILTYEASNNLIYNNDFIDDEEKQADTVDSVNSWDNGYEYGGNYWSDYKGKDEFDGPNQDEPGSDETGDTPYVIDQDNQDHYPSMTTLVYDVTIINVTSSVHTYAGWTVDVNVTFKNNGYTTEDLIVIAHYDNNTIGTTTIIGLASDDNITVTISWDTTDVQLYTEYEIWAEAITVPGETIIEDNTLTEKTVEVRIPGDINGDEKVNILDISTVGLAYGTRPGDPKWNTNADVNEDKVINILDVSTTAKEYGKTA